MIKITDEMKAKARTILAKDYGVPAGYRVKIFMLESEKGLEGAEKDLAPTLAAAGFETKTEDQKSKETKGSDKGIVVEVGAGAWKGETLEKMCPPWAKVGQIVVLTRYIGKTDEEPKGSGDMFRYINDEDVLGFYEEKVNE